MSVGIVRVQKFTKGSVKGVEIHDRRLKEGISHTNPDIAWERSGENYDLCRAQNSNFLRATKERIEQLHLPRAVRKDAVVMAQVLVTSDREFFDTLTPGQTRKFFQDAYAFLADRYGKDNVVSAVVHMDERTPHMHFNFVPVTEDGKLSAKRVLTRTALIEQQTAFQKAVGVHYGLQRGKTREERIEQGLERKHMDTPEFKAYTTQLVALKNEISYADEMRGYAQESLENMEDSLERCGQDLKKEEVRLGEVQERLRESREKLAVETAMITGMQGGVPMKPLKERKKPFGGELTVEISKEDFERGQSAINALSGAQKALQTARRLPSVLERQNEEKALHGLLSERERDIGFQKNKIRSLETQVEDLTQQMESEHDSWVEFYYRVIDLIQNGRSCSRKEAEKTALRMYQTGELPWWAQPERDTRLTSYDDLER